MVFPVREMPFSAGNKEENTNAGIVGVRILSILSFGT
jgi:hypothetical protein